MNARKHYKTSSQQRQYENMQPPKLNESQLQKWETVFENATMPWKHLRVLFCVKRQKMPF